MNLTIFNSFSSPCKKFLNENHLWIFPNFIFCCIWEIFKNIFMFLCLCVLQHSLWLRGIRVPYQKKYYILDVYIKYEKKVKFVQSCTTLWTPMDDTVHGLLQARILEWVAFPFSRGSFQPRDQTQVSHIAGISLPAEPPGKPYISYIGTVSFCFPGKIQLSFSATLEADSGNSSGSFELLYNLILVWFKFS